MSDAVVAVIAVALFILAFWRIGWWRYFWLGLALYLGLFEAAAHHFTGRTISQQYWLWAATSDWWWLPAMLLPFGGLGLAVHLVWKKLHKED